MLYQRSEVLVDSVKSCAQCTQSPDSDLLWWGWGHQSTVQHSLPVDYFIFRLQPSLAMADTAEINLGCLISNTLISLETLLSYIKIQTCSWQNSHLTDFKLLLLIESIKKTPAGLTLLWCNLRRWTRTPLRRKGGSPEIKAIRDTDNWLVRMTKNTCVSYRSAVWGE